MFENIRDYVLREGKRIRPILFIIGYLGFAKKPAAKLYKSALALEILHDFMLIHDDIIDKSATRRGKPSMHSKIDNYMQSKNATRFHGQDLALVIGDVLYALAIQAFLSIEENLQRKEKALQKFIEISIYTGTGEFNELINGMIDIGNLKKKDIYQIYDLKSAYYTFALPLTTGAILAGARQKQIERLNTYGIYLGRSFQIKDDIDDIYENDNSNDDVVPEDLKESKRTILMWLAYHHSKAKDKRILKRILSKEKICQSDILEMQRIIFRANTIDHAKDEIRSFMHEATQSISNTTMQVPYKHLLIEFSRNILSLH